MTILVIIFSCIIAMFVFLGILFLNGKGAFLIAGYNTMSKKGKNKIDKIALCKFMGKMNFVIAFLMLLIFISILLNLLVLINVEVAIFIITIIFMAVYINVGDFNKRK